MPKTSTKISTAPTYTQADRTDGVKLKVKITRLPPRAAHNKTIAHTPTQLYLRRGIPTSETNRNAGCSQALSPTGSTQQNKIKQNKINYSYCLMASQLDIHQLVNKLQ
uniref:Uncharacterized protein n=1 Tax=Rhizophora mucronata TaxID=61149 RepID=A0A2P2NYH5_RHIMU